jgi:hypothetical protein
MKTAGLTTLGNSLSASLGILFDSLICCSLGGAKLRNLRLVNGRGDRLHVFLNHIGAILGEVYANRHRFPTQRKVTPTEPTLKEANGERQKP